MGVKLQKPGDPGHPGGNRRTYVRVNHQGHRKTRMFNSSKAAQAYAETVEYHLKHGEPERIFTAPEPPAAPPPGPTFAEASDRWLAVDGATFKGGTRDTYENILALYLSPVFGSRPITDITRPDVESWWATVRAKGLSRERLTNIRSVARGVFRRAVASGMIPTSPVDVIGGRLGREDHEVRQAEWLTEPDLTKVLAVAKEREPRFHPLLLTLASTGIRLGELLGLQVGDADLDRGKLSIRRAVRKFLVSSPKSGKPRTVDVPPVTVAVLRDWMDTIRAEAAVRGQEGLWLFPSLTGHLLDATYVRAALRRVLLAAGIRQIRLHDFRHTFVSLALQRGVPLLIVSRQIGHSSVAITDRVYGHLAPDATKQAADAWEAILTEHSRNPRATGATEPT